MVHPYFLRVAAQPERVNELLGRGPPGEGRRQLMFTEMFAVLFPANATFDDNVASYLEMIPKKFSYKPQRVPKGGRNTQRQVDNLFAALEMSADASEEEEGFYQFLLYLVEIYRRQRSPSNPPENLPREDHIFGFMSPFNLRDTKVVIIAKDPPKYGPSSGLAFHDSAGLSTKQLLDFANFEMRLVDSLTTGEQKKGLTLPPEYLAAAKQHGNLQGWINQKVLLLHSWLSHKEPYWTSFTNCLVQYLSEERDHLVFILLGRAAAAKRPFIDHIKHCVVRVHHPSYFGRRKGGAGARLPLSPTRYLEWSRALPLINANFYWYQLFKSSQSEAPGETSNGTEGIDWSQVQEAPPSLGAGDERRSMNPQSSLWNTDNYRRYGALFEAAIDRMTFAEKGNGGAGVDAYVLTDRKIGGNETALIVRRCRKNGRLILRKGYKYHL